jgi:CBS domain-containing protein
MPDDPMQEFRVALAGPVVSVLVGAALLAIQSAATGWPGWQALRSTWTGGPFLARLGVLNISLAAFNLIPAFPMDGGRVLRALLATRMEYTRATAAHVGQTLALLFGLIGLFTDPFLVFIALFVWIGAEQEAAMVQVKTFTGGIPVQRIMLTDFRTLQPDDTLAEAVKYTLAGWQQDFPVVFGDRVLGVLTREDLVRVLSERGAGAPVRDAMNREFTFVDSHDMLEKALTVLQNCKCRSVPVEHDGRLVGVLTTENVGEFLMIQSALQKSRRAASQQSAIP